MPPWIELSLRVADEGFALSSHLMPLTMSWMAWLRSTPEVCSCSVSRIHLRSHSPTQRLEQEQLQGLP